MIRLEAAIDVLVEKGTVDTSGLGTSGNSRKGYQTRYALTHPSKAHLSAAVISDALTGFYSKYLFDGSIANKKALNANYSVNASGSFWDNCDQWLEYETVFNIDRAQAPVLFSLHGLLIRDMYSPTILEVMGAFRLNDKPME